MTDGGDGTCQFIRHAHHAKRSLPGGLGLQDAILKPKPMISLLIPVAAYQMAGEGIAMLTGDFPQAFMLTG